MTASIEATLVEIRNHLKVLHNEAVETRRVLKMLVGVLNDTRDTVELLRAEMHYLRTHREQTGRAERLSAELGVVADVEPEPG